jgi:hypothetical protein
MRSGEPTGLAARYPLDVSAHDVEEQELGHAQSHNEPARAMLAELLRLGFARCGERLHRAAGIADVETRTREGWARFPSVDELIRIEAKGSPLAGFIDEPSYERVLEASRRELGDFRDAQGRLALRLDATIVTARKS